MKTDRIFSIKSGFMAMLILLGLSITSCRDSTLKSQEGQKRSPKVEVPSIDLQAAALLGDLETIRQHIEAGSDLNVKDETMGSTPLITTAVFGKTEAAKMLIDAGADVNIQNYQGATALHSAAFLCREEIVRMLIDNGADKSILNNFGSTALMSVEPPFTDVKFIYDQFSKDLGPFGLKLDYKQVELTRPVIADMLR